jgi:hypothetical protein
MILKQLFGLHQGYKCYQIHVLGFCKSYTGNISAKISQDLDPEQNKNRPDL